MLAWFVISRHHLHRTVPRPTSSLPPTAPFPLSPFPATLPKNLPVSLIIATLPKSLSVTPVFATLPRPPGGSILRANRLSILFPASHPPVPLSHFPAIPFLFTLLRTLLHSPKPQHFCFQPLPHSLQKTTRGGGGIPSRNKTKLAASHSHEPIERRR